MKRVMLLSLLLFVMLAGAACVEAYGEWLESGTLPDGPDQQNVDPPLWGAWFLPGEVWMREAVGGQESSGPRFFCDVKGEWYFLEDGTEGVPVPCEPPGWYPWQDTPEKRGLTSKGKEESAWEKNPSFSWGEWENHFGGWFRRVNPPGPPLLGASHMVDEKGDCWVLVVYPGATPRRVERFSWFPGFPPGHVIRPETTVLVKPETGQAQ
ncbi:MAG TPA: hypothetical protein PLP89_08610 [Synergistales bacterium]|nr:hypothetical protein [Synergistales bacterium]